MQTHSQRLTVDLIDIPATAHFGIDSGGERCVVSVEVFGIEFTSGPVFDLVADQALDEVSDFLAAA